LKIAYIYLALPKREKSGNLDKAIFTSFQTIKKKVYRNQENTQGNIAHFILLYHTTLENT